jgi:hypothetical protein
MPRPIFTVSMSHSLTNKINAAKRGGTKLSANDWQRIADDLNAEFTGSNLDEQQVRTKANKLKQRAKVSAEVIYMFDNDKIS